MALSEEFYNHLDGILGGCLYSIEEIDNFNISKSNLNKIIEFINTVISDLEELSEKSLFPEENNKTSKKQISKIKEFCDRIKEQLKIKIDNPDSDNNNITSIFFEFCDFIESLLN